jgi:hypothetical protein
VTSDGAGGFAPPRGPGRRRLRFSIVEVTMLSKLALILLSAVLAVGAAKDPVTCCEKRMDCCGRGYFCCQSRTKPCCATGAGCCKHTSACCKTR